MKILFVENRYKTYLWQVIAKELVKEGHEIHWIVQNHMFKPVSKNVNVLPYPKKLTDKKKYTPEIKKIIQADRGLNYFGIQSDDFIFWYEKRVNEVIEKVSPDLVFGESTLFHELLVIEACKKRNILYLHPSTCRYPSNRFSFYLYDTLMPHGNSGEKWDDVNLTDIVDSIAHRKSVPDYMKKSFAPPSKIVLLKDKLTLTIGHYLGEKYNTPSPFKKKNITRHFQNNIKNWENNAIGLESIQNGFHVLYAMQMQPEANIDVWGNPNNNQVKVLERIIQHLGENDKLIIKPNPKSKYEISNELNNFVEKHRDKVIPLKHQTKMDDLWPKVDLVVTVTGTVSIECIFANKPVVMLGKSLQATQKNCILLSENESLSPIIEQIKSGTFPKLTEIEKNNYLQLIIDTSFPGTNGDGLQGKHYIEDKTNFEALLTAYKKIINERRANLHK